MQELVLTACPNEQSEEGNRPVRGLGVYSEPFTSFRINLSEGQGGPPSFHSGG